MTREEYIDFANALKNNYTIDFDKLPEFCDMATSVLSGDEGDSFSRQAIEEINSEIPKVRELFDIAYEYNKKDSTRTELSQKCTTYLADVWQTLSAIVDNYSPAENKEDMVSQAAYEQIKWERDIAIQQLKDLGYGLGEKPKENKGEWIPIEKRKPKCCGVYYVTRLFGDGFEEQYITDASFFDGSDKWHDDNRINHDRDYLNDVVAWFEAEPYKKGE